VPLYYTSTGTPSVIATMSGGGTNGQQKSSSVLAAGAAVAALVGTALLIKRLRDEQQKSVVVTLPDWLVEYEASFKVRALECDRERAKRAKLICARKASF